MSDPTKIDIRLDPTHQIISGTTAHGNIRFEAPYASQITEQLWMGGCENGLVLPAEITDVVSLYPWERYTQKHRLMSFVEVTMYDSALKPDETEIFGLADWVNTRIALGGQVLVHCQAGLNRSGLVVATSLVRAGLEPRAAIELLREKRSHAVLCNPTFHEWVWNLGQETS